MDLREVLSKPRSVVKLAVIGSLVLCIVGSFACGWLSPGSTIAAIATVAPAEWHVGSAGQRVDLLQSAMINTARGTLRLFEHSEDLIDTWLANGDI